MIACQLWHEFNNTINTYRIIMKKSIQYTSLLWLIFFTCCNQKKSDTKESEVLNYNNEYNPISFEGQEIFPEMTTKPLAYWSVTGVMGENSSNQLGIVEQEKGIQNHLLAQSISGLVNRAVDEGKSNIAIWFKDHLDRKSYSLSETDLNNMNIPKHAEATASYLALNEIADSDGLKVQIKDIFDGYVLTDVERNPESAIVASVASHIYNSIIVDVRDKSIFDKAGYKMSYDATKKTTVDSWKEFKDKCSNKALVVMPVQTGELRDFAIKNNLFVLNINKNLNEPELGQNIEIFEEVLRWLDPDAPVLGWESNVDEAIFVDRASRTGHIWIPSDWSYNLPLTSILYSQRQESILAKVENPKNYDYDKKKNYISFYLSDGDNVQWMLNGFVEQYFTDSIAKEMKLGFGYPSALAQLAPAQFRNIIDKQYGECTLIESLGGGYLYPDNFGIDVNRKERMKKVAENVAASMSQHRVKVLGLIAHDVRSESAKEGFQAYIEANDQLEGIVAIQYSPYAGGEGDIMWFKNQRGYEIPVITAKFSLWNHEDQNLERQGTPAYIANKLKEQAKEETFSLISLHAWSAFGDTKNPTDFLKENEGGIKRGAISAKYCTDYLDESFEIISVQELIWRIRMENDPTQTKSYLSKLQ